MPSRLFSDVELERLRTFPEISSEELIRYFTLTAEDVQFVDRRRRNENRLGIAVQLCTLPWLGFVPDDVGGAPVKALERLAQTLDTPITDLGPYGRREQTRTEHLRHVAVFLGWRAPGDAELKELDQFLLARAMEHDSPALLFRLAVDHLRASQVIRPGAVTLIERVAAAREAARAETYQRIEHILTPERRRELDELLVVDPQLGSTRLHWLAKGPGQPSPATVKAELDKLAFLRRLDAHQLDLSILPAARRRFLSQLGRRSSAQALARREPERRYPILVAMLAQTAVDVVDEIVYLYDQTVSATESRAKRRLDEALAERAKASEGRLSLLAEILAVVADPSIPDDEVGGRLRRRLGMDRLRAAQAGASPRLPRDHGHLEMIEASYSHVREFAPAVLAAITFDGGTEATDLLVAVRTLVELNASGARKVPDDAPTDFVPIRWRGYLERAERDGNVTAYRHYWELCVLLALRDALRSGDVHVPRSRRYADPADYLITPSAWEGLRSDFCQLVAKSPDAEGGLAALDAQLHQALGDLEGMLASGNGSARIDDDGQLVISRLSAEAAPESTDELRSRLFALLPRPHLSSLLIEMDRRTGFSAEFSHAGGKTSRPPELLRNLYAVLIAQACNFGFTAMAEASGISYDTLAWTAEWYLREDTLRAANVALVNYQHRLPMSKVWGGGTLSSSDGQRFPTKGKSISARALSRYFVDEGISTYTHVSDQHSTYGTKVIVATESEATYVLDEILGNATDLPIAEHVTDTHGVTLVNFALFDLVGLSFSPRIRDLGKITLYRTGTKADFTRRYPNAGPLLTAKIDTGLITEHWDDLLRLAGSLKFGATTASLIVGKLCASSRQNALAAALKEYGALRRTIHAARYLSDEACQRRTGRCSTRARVSTPCAEACSGLVTHNGGL